MNQIIEKEVNIENMIYEIRGKQVMLASDLAQLYQCKNGTKEINQAVKNNINKFPKRFSFVLDDSETEELLVKIFDQKKEKRGGRYKNPRVFTEQGVAMLSTILKTNIATEVSIAIMDAFISMRKYISNNLIEQKHYNDMLLRHDSEIKILQHSFEKFEEKKKINEIYFEGQIYDAYSKIMDIFKETKEELIIIDGYADKNVLDMIRNINKPVLLIIKNKSLLTKLDIKKYYEQYDNLQIKYSDVFHDRYIIIDKIKVYHLGASINHAGSKVFSINKLEDEIVIDTLLDKINNIK